MGSSSIARRGVMLVIASPSGAGKTSITRALLERDANLSLSVSVTTRAMRQGEVEGVHYFFRSIEAYTRMREQGELLEWAQVHDNYYGTPKAEVAAQIDAGRDILFDIDYQGTQQLYEKCRQDMVSVFVLPPSIAELRRRLEMRAQDSAEVISRRLHNALVEMEHWAEYDYVIVNDDLETSCQTVTNILQAARTDRTRQVNLNGFVKDLQSQIKAMGAT